MKLLPRTNMKLAIRLPLIKKQTNSKIRMLFLVVVFVKKQVRACSISFVASYFFAFHFLISFQWSWCRYCILGSGIFSPLTSNSATSNVRHHPVGAPSSNVSSAHRLSQDPESPRSIGEVTSSVRSLTDMSRSGNVAADVTSLERRPSGEERRRKTDMTSSQGNLQTFSDATKGGTVDSRRLSDTPPPALARSPAMRARHGSGSGRDHRVCAQLIINLFINLLINHLGLNSLITDARC